MSTDPENEYFSDGISEEIINALAKIGGLRVAARTSAFFFKGKQVDLSEVGRKLGVNTVLEGSVRKSGDRVRITAQLINVANGYHLWSERYDRRLEDVFAVQDEIAHAIVEQLRVKLAARDEAPLVGQQTQSLDAYKLYLEGRHHWAKMTRDGLASARDCYEQAISKDPNYAKAVAGIADTYMLGSYWGGLSAEDAYPKARQAAERALELNASEAEALCSLATVQTFYDLDWSSAEASFDEALKLEPKNAYIYMWYGTFLNIVRRDADAIAAYRRAYELDPLSNMIGSHYGQGLSFAGRREEAVEIVQEVIDRDPADYFSHHVLGYTYRELLMIEESIAHSRTSVQLSEGSPWIEANLALTCYRFGDRSEAEEIFSSIKERANQRDVWPGCFTLMHLIRGEVAEAIPWLTRSRDTHDVVFTWFNVFRRTFRSLNLANDSRIDAILAEAGIP